MACRFARFARSVPPVLPVLPSNPSACAHSNESCLSGDPAYRRVCTRGRQYPPSLAPSLARPELNGRKRTERNGTAKKRGKRNGTERDGTDNKTERDGNGAFFFMPTVYNSIYTVPVKKKLKCRTVTVQYLKSTTSEPLSAVL